MLQTERNADYGNAEGQSDGQVGQGEFPPKNEEPDDVEDQAAGTEVAQDDLPAERPQHKSSNLKTLQPEWYADDGYAQYYTSQAPEDGPNQPSKQHPDYVADKSHHSCPLSCPIFYSSKAMRRNGPLGLPQHFE